MGGLSGVETCGSFADLIPIPRENVRAELRRKPGLADGGGGTGISLKVCTFRSERESRDDGVVEVLSRADEAALLY